MSDVFISYARSTAKQAQAVAEALRGLGHDVWLDDELPAHRAYTDVIEERLKAAKAVVVVWSAEAAKSHWVRAEANTALEAGTLVQLTVDGAMPPMPFGQIQCADMQGWSGDLGAPGWRKVAASVADLVVSPAELPAAAPPPAAPLALYRAIALNPGSAACWFFSGWLAVTTGAPERAIHDIETSMRLDPISPVRPMQVASLGLARFLTGRYAEAVTLLRESAQSLTANASLWAVLASSYGHLGQAAEARAALARYRALSVSPLEAWAKTLFAVETDRAVVLQGIALAEDPAP